MRLSFFFLPLLLTPLYTGTAQAESSYLLQLGSFPSEQEAHQHWDGVYSTNGDLLVNVPPRIARATLPPDDMTVYRLQAGPLPGKAEAQRLCSVLASRKQECYVVETALPQLPSDVVSKQETSTSSDNDSVFSSFLPWVDSEPAQPDQTAVPPVTPPATQTKESGFFAKLWSTSDEESQPLPSTLPSPGTSDTAEPEPLAAAPVPAPMELAPVPALANMDSSERGNVNVAEAVRVPLTQPNQFVQPQRISTAPGQLGVLKGYPSQQFHQKSLWAQLSYFEDQQSALAYWEQFRMSNPGMPPLRIRITRPYNLVSTGESRVSLRVGSFVNGTDVGSFCRANAASDLHCQVIKDLGSSATANQPRYREPYNRYAGRNRSSYRAAAAQQLLGPQASYWVQLGAYASPREADYAWKYIQEYAGPALKNHKPHIATPSMGSNVAAGSYRLRTGPFALRLSADNLCSTLRQAGQACLVVQSQ